jgi:hypothetical protein
MDLDLTMWVWVGVYTNSDDVDDVDEVRVFSSQEKVEEWRTEIARDNWDDCGLDAEFDEDRYWEYVGGSTNERFEWYMNKVED